MLEKAADAQRTYEFRTVVLACAQLPEFIARFNHERNCRLSDPLEDLIDDTWVFDLHEGHGAVKERAVDARRNLRVDLALDDAALPRVVGALLLDRRDVRPRTRRCIAPGRLTPVVMSPSTVTDHLQPTTSSTMCETGAGVFGATAFFFTKAVFTKAVRMRTARRGKVPATRWTSQSALTDGSPESSSPWRRGPRCRSGSPPARG